MPINTQNSRHLIKRSNLTGVTPTVPVSSDFTDGTWLNTDIRPGEFFYNIPDKKLWIGTNTTPEEITGQLLDIYNSIIYNSSNTNTGDNSIIAGINNDNIAQNSLILGNNNNNNSILSANSIIAGSNNTNNASYSSIITGSNNTNNAGGYSSIITGSNNTNNVVNSIITGSNNTNNADNSIIIGDNHTLNNIGLMYGYQYGLLVGTMSAGVTTNSGVTANTTPILLLSPLNIDNNTVFRVECKAIAINITTGDVKEWSATGLIKNIAGTTSLVGAMTFTSTVGDAALAATTITAAANNTTDTLDITVTGLAATTIYWAVDIKYVLRGL